MLPNVGIAKREGPVVELIKKNPWILLVAAFVLLIVIGIAVS